MEIESEEIHHVNSVNSTFELNLDCSSNLQDNVENDSNESDYLYNTFDTLEIKENADFQSSFNTLEMENVDDIAWLTEKLHNYTDSTLGETIHKIMTFFVEDCLKKKSLEKLLILLDDLLPKPNKLPKTRYFLDKLLHSLLPQHEDLIKRHQFCEDCYHYLRELGKGSQILLCNQCKNDNVNGMFIEYNIKEVLKNAFEERDLRNLIDKHRENEKNDNNIVCDFTSGSEYKQLKENVLKGDYDVCLAWNTDGASISTSSKGEIWPVQVKVLNIPPQNRRSYQFLAGIFYTTKKKPAMNCFLKPFARKLKEVYEFGVTWHDKKTNTTRTSTVIAPIATLDCPARSAVQNVMQFNGCCGCSFCEHPGMTCETGAGHNRVYPTGRIYQNRTKERMTQQAESAIRNNYEHVNGVKGPTIVSTIPHFNIATSFVPDYMHAILNGIVPMLQNLWFDSKNKEETFYINKRKQEEIDKIINQIQPPDIIARIPKTLSSRVYWKASEERDYLLFYFPIILKDKLPKKYYEHFLILSYATRILLQSEIHLQEIDLAESLFELFVNNVENLYGLEKCSFNVHQLLHMAESVRRWGPLWVWSMFTFEDANGYFKNLNHGPNKVDVEIVNTLKMLNAYYVLRNKMCTEIYNNELDGKYGSVLGAPIKISLSPQEIQVLENLNLITGINIQNGMVHVFPRASINNETFTSEMYQRQKKRRNNVISWNNRSYFGIIQFFIIHNGSIYALIRELTRDYQITPIIASNVDFTNILIPVRLTYCITYINVSNITEKLLMFNNHLCILPNMFEKKL